MGVAKAVLSNMLWVLHFSRTNINTMCIIQLLTLVHDGCLWLGEPIPITDMLIHHITRFPNQGVDPAEEFGGKSKEKKLIDRMKGEFGLVKKLNGYTVHSITNTTVQFSDPILACKVMRK